MKRRASKLLPPEIKAQVTYTGEKLSTCFNVKEQSKFQYQHDMVYWYTMELALMIHVEKIILVRILAEFQNA